MSVCFVVDGFLHDVLQHCTTDRGKWSFSLYKEKSQCPHLASIVWTCHGEVGVMEFG